MIKRYLYAFLHHHVHYNPKKVGKEHTKFSQNSPKRRKICVRNEYFAKAQSLNFNWGIITTPKRETPSPGGMMVTNSRYDYKNHNHKHPQKNHPIPPDLTVLVAQGHLAGLHGVVHRVHLLVLLQLPTHRWAQLRVKHFPNLILPMSKTFLEILPNIL